MNKSNKAKVKVGFLTQDEVDKQMGWTAKDAQEYLKLAVKEFKKDNDFEAFLHCVMRAVKWVGVTNVAHQVGMTRQGIYDALDRDNANPSFKTLSAILGVLGVKTTFVVNATETARSFSQNVSRRSYASL